MRGSGCRVSALAKPATAAAATTTDAMTSGDDQPSTTPWETASTTRVTATVISSAPPTSSRCDRAAAMRVFAAPRTDGDRAAAARPTGTLTRNTARQLVN